MKTNIQPLKFILIGVAGFIAPRHLKAIKDVNGELIAALDKSDSVGILDSYFPDAKFFTDFEKFDSYINSIKNSGVTVDYLSICTPNYLHSSHIQYGLRLGVDVICEKPLVLTLNDLDELEKWESITNKKVNTILQLRHHEKIIYLKEKIENSKRLDWNVSLTYITSRGDWYLNSWKNEISKSGGVSTNIGIHFFDMLSWIFGKPSESIIKIKEEKKASGKLILEKAIVNWFLSIDSNDLPNSIDKNKKTFRSILIDGEELEFSEGFTELHSISYKNIIEDKGFGLKHARESIYIAENIRNSNITP